MLSQYCLEPNIGSASHGTKSASIVQCVADITRFYRNDNIAELLTHGIRWGLSPKANTAGNLQTRSLTQRCRLTASPTGYKMNCNTIPGCRDECIPIAKGIQ